jgi:tRNA threonylcarbamoyladenosine biosynthesis protein TsaB
LLALCAELLDRGGLAFSELDRIAVGVGPGTFTGLRIGIATARALARASQVPLVGIPTLKSLALNALSATEAQPPEAVVAVLDARRNEVFAAAWSRRGLEGSAQALIGPVALAPEALADQLTGLAPTPLALGEGAVAFREVLERSGAFVPDDHSELHRVTAASHCRIARELEPSDPEQVQPEYLRLPDAELARRAADKR